MQRLQNSVTWNVEFPSLTNLNNIFALWFLDLGYTMHFDTSTGNAEQSALLESRILYPKRKTQCLQFFYKMTGSVKDRLVIWSKTDDGTGTVRTLKKLHTIWGNCFLFWTTSKVKPTLLKNKGYLLASVVPWRTCNIHRSFPFNKSSSNAFGEPKMVLPITLFLTNPVSELSNLIQWKMIHDSCWT